MNTDLFRELPEPYEPKCLERWAESVAAMDDMGAYADPAPTPETKEN